MSALKHKVVVVGAGPAGLSAAYELVKRDISPLVLERSDKVGGIARTEQYGNYRFDIGGHRFFTKVAEVQELWNEVLADDFLKVPRLSRIHYQGRFYQYPLEVRNALVNLGVFESALIILSYLRWKVLPYAKEDTFEQWVTNRFGRRLYLRFFKTYTEKVWGIPCNQIRSDWAAQRIKGLSLLAVARNALFGINQTKTLINEFDYPSLGPGMMWERFRDVVEERGGEVRLEVDVLRIVRDGNRIDHLTVQDGRQTDTVFGEQFITSMPLTELIFRLDPPPPLEVLEAARGLSYRDFLIVGLIVKGEKLFPDNWIYVHTPGVKVGRIQNFGNWSAAMVPEPGMSSLGMEYFCNEGDDLWEMPDAQLIGLATQELGGLGLADPADVQDGVVIRQQKAYPVYDATYKHHLSVIRAYLGTLENVQTIGRNGLHRYNNQDHSMLTGILAVRNLMGGEYDLWDVNTERSYHEDFVTEGRVQAVSAHQLPQALEA